MNTDTTPQPAHGEPWEKPDRDVDDYGNVRWLAGETGSFRDEAEALRATECWNLLAPHPNLSAVEVHSKEKMDEVRKILEGVDTYILNSKATPDAHTPERMISIRIHYALAKLNPPQG